MCVGSCYHQSYMQGCPLYFFTPVQQFHPTCLCTFYTCSTLHLSKIVTMTTYQKSKGLNKYNYIFMLIAICLGLHYLLCKNNPNVNATQTVRTRVMRSWYAAFFCRACTVFAGLNARYTEKASKPRAKLRITRATNFLSESSSSSAIICRENQGLKFLLSYLLVITL